MTAKIKLNAASGGGSFSLQAPSSSANNRVMTLPDSADGTILTTTNPKSGTIVQKKIFHAATNSYSTSQSYVETVITGSITPESSSSKIIITICLPVWPAAGSYLHVQLRSSGGNTNNDIGTWGDAYATNGSGGASYNSMYQWYHTTHNTTSAITYKVFCKKQDSNGNNWYFPNNNSHSAKNIGWLLTLEEQA